MFIMTLCVLSELSIPIEDFTFSLPACVFPIYRSDFKFVAVSWNIYTTQDPDLSPVRGNENGHLITTK